MKTHFRQNALLLSCKREVILIVWLCVLSVFNRIDRLPLFGYVISTSTVSWLGIANKGFGNCY